MQGSRVFLSTWDGQANFNWLGLQLAYTASWFYKICVEIDSNKKVLRLIQSLEKWIEFETNSTQPVDIIFFFFDLLRNKSIQNSSNTWLFLRVCVFIPFHTHQIIIEKNLLKMAQRCWLEVSNSEPPSVFIFIYDCKSHINPHKFVGKKTGVLILWLIKELINRTRKFLWHVPYIFAQLFVL